MSSAASKPQCEIERDARIARNKAILIESGLLKAAEDLKQSFSNAGSKPSKQKTKREQQLQVVERSSARLQAQRAAMATKTAVDAMKAALLAKHSVWTEELLQDTTQKLADSLVSPDEVATLHLTSTAQVLQGLGVNTWAINKLLSPPSHR